MGKAENNSKAQTALLNRSKARARARVRAGFGLRLGLARSGLALAPEPHLNQCQANSEACKGEYVAGSCASIGAAGNVAMQGGAY
jgi:hypothetical protein